MDENFLGLFKKSVKSNPEMCVKGLKVPFQSKHN